MYPGVPPGGYPGWGPPPGPTPSARSGPRWYWIVGSVVVALAVVVAGARAFGSFFGAVDIPPVSYPGKPGVAGQQLLPSMRTKPVTGWTIDINALLPEPGKPGAQFTEYVGSVGDKAYFVLEDLTRATDRWLLGVDVVHGRPLFTPVQIGAGLSTCLTNGPDRVICLSETDSRNGYEIFVVDADAGRIITNAPTDLKPSIRDESDLTVEQLGAYAVAIGYHGGTHGIGDDGKPTWFVEGDDRPSSISPEFAVTQAKGGPTTVFSTADGTVAATVPGHVTPYSGGFLVTDPEHLQGFRFYDERGRVVGQYQPPKGAIAIEESNGKLPWLSFRHGGRGETQLIFDGRGTPMVIVQVEMSPNASRFLGANLFIGNRSARDDPAGVWDKFDLKTGARVSSCPGLPLGHRFVGSDGAVVIGQFADQSSSAPLVAVDSDTCAVLWQIDKPPPMWAVGATLVAAPSGTGTLVSLVPADR
ncbi:hypothetical protein KIH27_11075 [Mycobacterium sp. M1]|uniref:Uncharacterized protein n=1 Tax=Mycolicibacter acidiphilus TaxID=2835306 RepID=A0ABS5RIK7_9MYCO|nr:hypothetical protein [Mycolicibacter acidiphilus]MBS9534127.1 hypothetical protein [Mycolicibacter acidiphilus]